MTIPGIKLCPGGITKAHLRDANIGEDYWGCDFNNYAGSHHAVTLTKGYLSSISTFKPKGIGLMFAGRVGTGKTTLMAITLKYLTRANWTVYMTSLSELLEEIKRSWDNKNVTQIDRCKHVQFLGLDDLGKEHAGPTGFSAVTFDNLLRYRIQHCLPTFFTTNLDKKEILHRYGEATLSLIEGKTKIVPVAGKDYRVETLKHEIR